jgi:hypothetical protein
MPLARSLCDDERSMKGVLMTATLQASRVIREPVTLADTVDRACGA